MKMVIRQMFLCAGFSTHPIKYIVQPAFTAPIKMMSRFFALILRICYILRLKQMCTLRIYKIIGELIEAVAGAVDKVRKIRFFYLLFLVAT